MTQVKEERAKEILAYGNEYLKLRDSMEADLRKSGFNPSTDPPCREPDISSGVSSLSPDTLRELYDSYLAYYDFISDDITRLEVYLRTTEKRASIVRAHIVLESAQHKKELSNAELRNAWVEVHPSYQAALKDHLYFKQMHAAQEQRLRKMSKAMDKVYWELWSRDQAHPDEKGSYNRMARTKANASKFAEEHRSPLFKKVGAPVR